MKLDLAETNRPAHATTLAAQARADGLDLVVALGGDGTVHEIVNGLLRPAPGPIPALAVVPGGDANVAARNLGLPNSAVEATGVLLDCVRAGSRRLVGIGRADDRFFILNAGLGFDAAVVRAVSAARRQGHPSTPTRYVRAALGHYLNQGRRRDQLRVEVDGEPTGAALRMALVCNTSPWTYAGRLPLRPTPQASYERGLDLFGLSSMSAWAVGRAAFGLLGEAVPAGRAVHLRHDLRSLRVLAQRPVHFQLDGEYLGERTEVHFQSLPRALEVIAPAAR